MPNNVRLTEVMGRPELSAVLDYTKQLDNVDEPYLHIKACMAQNALLGADFPDYFQLSTGSKPQVDAETNLVTSGYRKMLSKKMAAEQLQAAQLSSELPSLSANKITRQVMYPEVNDWEIEESATKISKFNKDLNVECFRRVNVSYAVPKYDESLPKAHAFLAAIYLQYSTIEKDRGYTIIKTREIQCSSYALVSSIFKGYSQVTADDGVFFVSDVSVKGLGTHVVRANIMLANEGASVPLVTWSKVEDWLNVIYQARYANPTNDAVVKQLPAIVQVEGIGQVKLFTEDKVEFEVHGAKTVSVSDLAKVLEWFAHLLDVSGKQTLNQMKIIKPSCQRGIVAGCSKESEPSQVKMHRRNAMDKAFASNRSNLKRSGESAAISKSNIGLGKAVIPPSKSAVDIVPKRLVDSVHPFAKILSSTQLGESVHPFAKVLSSTQLSESVHPFAKVLSSKQLSESVLKGGLNNSQKDHRYRRAVSVHPFYKSGVNGQLDLTSGDSKQNVLISSPITRQIEGQEAVNEVNRKQSSSVKTHPFYRDKPVRRPETRSTIDVTEEFSFISGESEVISKSHIGQCEVAIQPSTVAKRSEDSVYPFAKLLSSMQHGKSVVTCDSGKSHTDRSTGAVGQSPEKVTLPVDQERISLVKPSVEEKERRVCEWKRLETLSISKKPIAAPRSKKAVSK